MQPTNLRRLFLLLALAVSVGACMASAQTSRDIELVFESDVANWPDASKRWALLVGVSEYQDQTISPVPGAENDAEALRDALVEYAGFPREQVLMLTSSQDPSLQPGRTAILRDLLKIKSQIPPDGLLMFAFAGHGIEREGRAFLIPQDASLIQDVDFLESTAISLESLKTLIRGMNAQQVVMLLDACRNDPRAGRSFDDLQGNTMTAAQTGFSFAKANEGVEAFVTLYATAVGYRAWETYDREAGKQRGIFSKALVSGLAGKAANANGDVTLANLVSYVQQEVPQMIRQEYGDDRQQRPFVQIGGYKAEDLVLSRVAQPTLGDDADWALTSATKDVSKLVDHIQKFPGCPHEEEATYQVVNQVRELGGPQVVLATWGERPDAPPVDPALFDEFTLPRYLEKFPNGQNAADAHWSLIKNSNRAIDFANHIQRYPNSPFAELAKIRWQGLEEQQAWDEAKQANSAESYRKFMEDFSNSRFSGDAQRALSNLDREAWGRVRDSRSAADYQSYLGVFPQGDNADNARNRISDIEDWGGVDQSQIASLNEYIAGHPAGMFINEAYRLRGELDGPGPVERSPEMIEIEAWNGAVSCGEARCYAEHYQKFSSGAHADEAFYRAADSAEGELANAYNLDEYLRQFPNGSFAELARQGVALNRFERAETIEDYQAVIDDFPSSPWATRAQDRIDELRKDQVAAADTPEALRGFIEQYPGSRYAGWAQGRLNELDQASWEPIGRSKMASQYREYLGKFPGGLHAAEATERIADIEDWQAALAADNEAGYESYKSAHPSGLFIVDAMAKLGPSPSDPSIIGVPHMSRRERNEYVWIPAGSFNMGCAPGDSRCEENEKPQHRVTISKGFWLGATEVDIAAYQRFVDASGGRYEMPTAPLWDKKRRVTNHPITGPSWEEAQAYCSWAGGRLPTEAEWEYAARGGEEDAIYPLNDENSREKANFKGEEGNDRARYTAAVKSYDPNGYGLFDMAGNVWEWTRDFYGETYFLSSPAADPQGPDSGEEHVVRGGSWYSDANEHLRISFRTSFPKGGNLVGFRCVIEDTPAVKELLVGPGVK